MAAAEHPIPFASLPEWEVPDGLAFEERTVVAEPHRGGHRAVVRELGGLVRNVRVEFAGEPGLWRLHCSPSYAVADAGLNVSADGEGDGVVVGPTTPLFKLAHYESSVTATRPFSLRYEFAPSSEVPPAGWVRLPLETNLATQLVVSAGYAIAGFRVAK